MNVQTFTPILLLSLPSFNRQMLDFQPVPNKMSTYPGIYIYALTCVRRNDESLWRQVSLSKHVTNMYQLQRMFKRCVRVLCLNGTTIHEKPPLNSSHNSSATNLEETSFSAMRYRVFFIDVSWVKLVKIYCIEFATQSYENAKFTFWVCLSIYYLS